MFLRIFFSFLLFVIVPECTTTDISVVYPIDKEDWEILSFHGLEQQQLELTMAIASEVVELNWRKTNVFKKLVAISKDQRMVMGVLLGGVWSCFTQTKPLNYSVLDRATVYLKLNLEEYDYLRIFCLK